MDAGVNFEARAAAVAAAMGERARMQMLSALLDGRARTSTELAVLAEVSPATGSAHLKRLTTAGLVKVLAQGRHRYHSLAGRDVAQILEKVHVLAGGGTTFVPNTPNELRAARCCYDHIAGGLGVALHDRVQTLRWLRSANTGQARNYELTPDGALGLARLGIDAAHAQKQRRRFAYACIDWSERRPHLAGALGAALLEMALKRKWIVREMDSRALEVTSFGRQELLARFGLNWAKPDVAVATMPRTRSALSVKGR